MSFLGETVSVLRRKEAGTGEPDASTVMLSHASDSSSLDVVVRFFTSPQPTGSQSFVVLLSRFSWLAAKGAS